MISKLFPSILCLLLCVISFTGSASAQQMYFNYTYKFEPAMITEPPEIGRLEVEYPETAKKNGVEGTVRVSATLGEDSKVHDITIVDNLGYGTGEAVVAGLQRFTFKPAGFQGKPTAMKFVVTYVVSLYYDENDNSVTKPKILTKPMPAYPASQIASGVKGKVSVTVLLKSNGDVEVLGVNSVMERAFDKAAQEAAKNLKFTPAVHKKSKLPISQQMTVEYNFKP